MNDSGYSLHPAYHRTPCIYGCHRCMFCLYTVEAVCDLFWFSTRSWAMATYYACAVILQCRVTVRTHGKRLTELLARSFGLCTKNRRESKHLSTVWEIVLKLVFLLPFSRLLNTYKARRWSKVGTSLRKSTKYELPDFHFYSRCLFMHRRSEPCRV